MTARLQHVTLELILLRDGVKLAGHTPGAMGSVSSLGQALRDLVVRLRDGILFMLDQIY